MTQYGTLRLWAAALMLLGMLGALATSAGTIVWAIEVDGAWPTIGVLLVGGSVAVFLAAFAVAFSQALRALADLGETVSAR